MNRALATESLILHQQSNLWQVLQLLALDRGCVHARIGMALQNPNMTQGNDHGATSSCGSTCPVCLNEFGNLFLPLSHSGLTHWLKISWSMAE